MKFYVIVQEGVYRHSIFGVYSKRELAISESERLASEDFDSYHDYMVYEFERDVTRPWAGAADFYRYANEADMIHSASKSP